MTTRRIALIVDHPQRDLAGLVLTAFELCQRGFTCHLVPLNLQYTELFALAPDFVLLNYLRRFNEPVVRHLGEVGIQYGLLDTEGAVFSGPDEYAELHCEDPALLRGASCVCLWGPTLARYLVERGAYAPEQVSVTGCPRFDLYSPAWHEPMWGVSPARRNGAPARILFNTNFGIVNPRFTSSAENIEVYHRALGWSYERLEEFTGRERAAIRETIAIAQRLATRFSNAHVVVRVHPHESPTPYKEALDGLPNVEVNDSGPVQHQLFRAAAVVQRSCTTAIESALAGVPTLSPRWIVPPMEAPMAEAVSLGCESMAELEARVEEILCGRYVPSEEHLRNVNTVLENWFFRQDGLAFRRVSDVVERAMRPRAVNERACRRLMYFCRDTASTLSRSRHQASRWLRWVLRTSPDWSFRQMRVVPSTAWARSAKAFTVDDVRALVGTVARVFQANDWPARTVTVRGARDSGHYLYRAYDGHSVTLSCA